MESSIFETVDTAYIRRQRRLPYYIGFCIFIIVVAFGLSYVLQELEESPASFPVGVDVVVPEGTTVSGVSNQFKNEGLVQSGLYFYLVLETNYKDKYIQAGNYRFPEKLNAHELARAIIEGSYASPALSVTFPEGFKVKDMRIYLPESFKEQDLSDISSLEGYLFPDTYFIKTNTTFDELVKMMQDNYKEKTEPLHARIATSTLTESEVVTLASIVEREGKDTESMSIIAGILLHRLTLGMPLQVDATLDYLLGKTSAELTASDLKIDSPYNTYTHKGIPPSPIANPGLTALTAVLKPTQTAYLYYLTGNDGHFYYAKTFEEHKKNKERYLR